MTHAAPDELQAWHEAFERIGIIPDEFVWDDVAQTPTKIRWRSDGVEFVAHREINTDKLTVRVADAEIESVYSPSYRMAKQNRWNLSPTIWSIVSRLVNVTRDYCSNREPSP